MPTRDSKTTAFTLIELLVVISIIGLLIGILLPVLGNAREVARTVVCLSNMRSLGQATEMYQNDNRARYPRCNTNAAGVTGFSAADRERAVWFNALDFYLRLTANGSGASADRNFESYKQDPVWLTFSEEAREDNRTIKMNDHIGDPIGPSVDNAFTREPQLREASATVMYVDGRAIDTPRLNGTPTNPNQGIEFSAEENDVYPRHENDTANVAFGDAHAASVKQEIRPSPTFPAWFFQGDPEQTLLWDFLNP